VEDERGTLIKEEWHSVRGRETVSVQRKELAFEFACIVLARTRAGSLARSEPPLLKQVYAATKTIAVLTHWMKGVQVHVGRDFWRKECAPVLGLCPKLTAAEYQGRGSHACHQGGACTPAAENGMYHHVEEQTAASNVVFGAVCPLQGIIVLFITLLI